MAARVAAQLSKESDVEVEIVKGGLLEFSVHIDGRKVVDTNRLLYPLPSKIVSKTRNLLRNRPF